MTFIPTTEVLVLGLEEAVDEYGDPVDVYARSRARIPAHISEQRAKVSDPSTGALSVMVNYVGTLPGHVDVERGFRLKDLKTGVVYQVERVHTPGTFIGAAPRRLELQLVT